MIKEIAFTGSSVTDMKRARAFYEDVLGLKPSAEMAGGKWIEYEVGRGTFAITDIDPKTPSTIGTSLAFEVDDIDATHTYMQSKGVNPTEIQTRNDGQKAFYINDPDGNRIELCTKSGFGVLV